MDIQALLDAAVSRGASDLHINPGRPPVLRIDGDLVDFGSERLGPDETERLATSICTPRHLEELAAKGSTDFGLAHASGNRFRASVYRQRKGVSAVLRLIPNKLLTLDQIGLPEPCRQVLRRPRASSCPWACPSSRPRSSGPRDARSARAAASRAASACSSCSSWTPKPGT